jgi:blue copper oxidase
VVSGLAGLLIVDDGTIAPAVLPDTWGIDDVALVLQDKRFTADGRIDYALTANDQLVGYAGDRLLVNGMFGPTWRAPQQWVRLRLLNGCNARILVLRLSDATPMLQIANEAGLLAVPLARSTLRWRPGERAEVLVNFSSASPAGDASVGQHGRGRHGHGDGVGSSNGSDTEVTALTMRVDLPRQPGAMSSPPARLPTAPAVSAATGATVRTFSLDGGMMGSPFTINGRRFDIAASIWPCRPARSRFGALSMPPAWPTRCTFMGSGCRCSRVTAVRRPLTSKVCGIPSSLTRCRPSAWPCRRPRVASSVPLMFHCHILEHEDAGMMGQFITT